MDKVREKAFLVICEFRVKGAWPDRYLNSLNDESSFSDRDKSLVTRLVYGVLQNIYLLDFYILHYSSVKKNRISPAVLDILRIGAYQLIFMDKIPESAAVNECVNLAGRYARGARGFVNAVLRNIARSLGCLPGIDGKDALETLSIQYSHPRWLIERLNGILGFEETKRLLQKNNEAPSAVLRVNTIKADMSSALMSLRSQSVEAMPLEGVDNALLLPPSGSVAALEAVRQGLVYVQDTASQLAVLALSPEKHSRVLDICAAPGGKSFLAAQLMENRGEILACDLYPKKLGLLKETSDRLGTVIIHTRVSDAAQYCREFDGLFDHVICDVPCSGFGIIRKKPDIRYKQKKDVENLPQIQYNILINAARYLKPGGSMVYSTCTILPEENEDVIKRFLANQSGYSLVAAEALGRYGSREMTTLWPQRNGTDGFFIAKLRRQP